MDRLDKDIIGLLQINARESVASLGRKLGISRSTVQDRINRLENTGAIRGYSLDLDSRAQKDKIRAFVAISFSPQNTALIVAELKTFAEVKAVHTLSGRYDLMVEISTADTSEMDTILDKLGNMSGILRTETSIVLNTRFKR